MTRGGLDQMAEPTIQRERTAGVRIYRPHTTTKRKGGIDWDAITPHCRGCGAKTGTLNRDDLCRICAPLPDAPPLRTPKPVRRTVPRPRAPKPRKAPRPRREGYDVDSIVEAYTGGQTIPDIARAMGVAHSGVRAAIVRAGVQLRDDRHRGNNTETGIPLDVDALVQAYSQGLSINEIAQQLGTTNRARIRRALLAAGVAVRKAGGCAPGQRGKPVDEQAVIADYQRGRTSGQLAEQYDVSAQRIRRILDRHNVQRRDDRALNSGKPREYDGELVAEVCRLYVDAQLSRAQIATRLGVGYKVVVTIMAREGVRAREGQSGHADGAAELKDQMRRLGVESRDVKAWAFREGLIDRIRRGIPSQELVDAYEAAHGGDE